MEVGRHAKTSYKVLNDDFDLNYLNCFVNVFTMQRKLMCWLINYASKPYLKKML